MLACLAHIGYEGAVECEAGLRTVPSDELANCVVVGPLAAGGRQVVQHRGVGVFEVRERGAPLQRFLPSRFPTLTSATGSFTVANSYGERPALRRLWLTGFSGTQWMESIICHDV